MRRGVLVAELAATAVVCDHIMTSKHVRYVMLTSLRPINVHFCATSRRLRGENVTRRTSCDDTYDASIELSVMTILYDVNMHTS